MSKLRLLGKALFVSACLILLLSACGSNETYKGDTATTGQVVSVNDTWGTSSRTYASSVMYKPDPKVYHLTVQVQALGSLTRQVEPASGSIVGFNGYVSGSLSGAVIEGKSIMRVLALSSDSALAPVGKTTIIKVVDSKSIALNVGDTISLKCRQQEEVIDPELSNEVPADRDSISTMELDGCKLVGPTVLSTQVPNQ